MLKLTQKTFFALLALSLGCQNQPDREQYQQQFRRQVDSLAELRIDSAYKAIQQRCDSLLLHQVPLWADSLAKAIQDSADKKKRV